MRFGGLELQRVRDEMITDWDLSSSQFQFKNICSVHVFGQNFNSIKCWDVLGVNCRAPDLVQRNHRVGDSEDEVDVVLRHLLCDQS